MKTERSAELKDLPQNPVKDPENTAFASLLSVRVFLQAPHPPSGIVGKRTAEGKSLIVKSDYGLGASY